MSMHPLRNRRGGAGIQIAVSFFVVAGFAAAAIELAWLQAVHSELQGVADASSHAAALELDGTADGLVRAATAARTMAAAMRVNGQASHALEAGAVTFGRYDAASKVFTPTTDPAQVTMVTVAPVARNVGLGLGGAVFQKVFDVSACGAVAQSAGNASVGEYGGPGLSNGHFDADTVDARYQCWGNTCTSVTRHTHQFDDKFNTTEFDFFAPLDKHAAINGCVDGSGVITCKPASYYPSYVWSANAAYYQGVGKDEDPNRTIPGFVPFKLLMVNPKLSPSATIRINGTVWSVADYGAIPVNALPVYTLGVPTAGQVKLTDLHLSFTRDAIASCGLHPSAFDSVEQNEAGVNNEWRSGALDIQAVRLTAKQAAGRSAGGHDPVVSKDAGLLWEAAFHWHWGSVSYTPYEAKSWFAAYDKLACEGTSFVDATGVTRPAVDASGAPVGAALGACN